MGRSLNRGGLLIEVKCIIMVKWDTNKWSLNRGGLLIEVKHNWGHVFE